MSIGDPEGRRAELARVRALLDEQTTARTAAERDVARLTAERDALGEALAKARTPGCKACGGGQ